MPLILNSTRLRLRYIFIFILLFVFRTASVLAQGEVVKQYEIAGIKVDGTKNLDKAVLISLSGLRVGQTITIPGEDIPKAIKNLWRQKLFGHVEINASRFEENKIYLRIRVEEKSRVSRYTIKGIRNGEIEDIRKKMDLRSGVIMTNSLKSSIQNTIKNYYNEKGYNYPIIKITEFPDTLLSNSNLIVININKGAKYKVFQIGFEGNENLSKRQLKKSMKNTKEIAKMDFWEFIKFKKNLGDTSTSLYYKLGNISLLRFYEYASEHFNPNIFKGAKFDRAKFEEDRNSLIAFYNTKGFRDAKIISDTVYVAGHKKLAIQIRVDEGRKYYFRNISWIGNTKYPDTLLTKILGIRKGDVYNQQRLEEKLNMSQAGDDVSALYMDDGYLFFHPEVNELLANEDSIDLEIRLFEGPQATINHVNISGNDKTNEKVVRRELRIRPGDKFDRSKLIRTQRELSTLGYFDPQQLQINPRPNPENGTVDIDIKVAEKPSDQLELSLGYGGAQTGLYGTVGLNFTNFSVKNFFNKKAWSPLPSGDGENLNIRVQANGFRQ
ncbi:MAG: outer membrane protein assembly factor, partial [Chitinophagales bacterium]|nr:outer membrane protein assembly factor [Chitinophagales bacterium]